MTVRLRAHHLLCMLAYVGEGYSAAFVDNYDVVVARLNAGEPVEIVEGPDDICAPLLREPGAHCRDDGPARRDEIALAEIGRLPGLSPDRGPVLDARLLSHLRAGFARRLIRGACADCPWSGLCDEVAGGGFSGARLG